MQVITTEFWQGVKLYSIRHPKATALLVVAPRLANYLAGFYSIICNMSFTFKCTAISAESTKSLRNNGEGSFVLEKFSLFNLFKTLSFDDPLKKFRFFMNRKKLAITHSTVFKIG